MNPLKKTQTELVHLSILFSKTNMFNGSQMYRFIVINVVGEYFHLKDNLCRVEISYSAHVHNNEEICCMVQLIVSCVFIVSASMEVWHRGRSYIRLWTDRGHLLVRSVQGQFLRNNSD